ncbi:hypothetical protein [Sansalvadorimonas verongulae]|uniref:hypothetical protein n=1 Tax=Sansalvadorimonas verongulae TaxID=2172824 RepID=UPI0012BCB58B|nr:hypothetical protein [Sansalvadorimonas verongulae]MTI12760.1 hypothetical protein [Sansalvadorimonas verongulae]
MVLRLLSGRYSFFVAVCLFVIHSSFSSEVLAASKLQLYINGIYLPVTVAAHTPLPVSASENGTNYQSERSDYLSQLPSSMIDEFRLIPFEDRDGTTTTEQLQALPSSSSSFVNCILEQAKNTAATEHTQAGLSPFHSQVSQMSSRNKPSELFISDESLRFFYSVGRSIAKAWALSIHAEKTYKILDRAHFPIPERKELSSHDDRFRCRYEGQYALVQINPEAAWYDHLSIEFLVYEKNEEAGQYQFDSTIHMLYSLNDLIDLGEVLDARYKNTFSDTPTRRFALPERIFFTEKVHIDSWLHRLSMFGGMFTETVKSAVGDRSMLYGTRTISNGRLQCCEASKLRQGAYWARQIAFVVAIPIGISWLYSRLGLHDTPGVFQGVVLGGTLLSWGKATLGAFYHFENPDHSEWILKHVNQWLTESSSEESEPAVKLPPILPHPFALEMLWSSSKRTREASRLNVTPIVHHHTWQVAPSGSIMAGAAGTLRRKH